LWIALYMEEVDLAKHRNRFTAECTHYRSELLKRLLEG